MNPYTVYAATEEVSIWSQVFHWGGIALAVIAVLVLLFLTFFTVSEQTRGVVMRFGKFVRVVMPGLNLKIPFIETWDEISLQVQEVLIPIDTKTEDNVTLKVEIALQYQVISGKEREAYFLLTDPEAQIQSYIFDVVRAKVPEMKLDEVFERKDDIATAVMDRLAASFGEFGHKVVKALVRDIDPDAKVKDAMNEINAAQRQLVAANAKAEAEKVILVKKAEGEAESKKLQGKGIADQRRAIVDGLSESVKAFQAGVEGSTPQDVMNLVLMTQYLDTLKSLGETSGTKTIFVPHSPGALSDLAAQLRNAMITAGEAETPAS